ncbi:hypothetical protein [Thermophilibacter sp.]|uniref:hypothetical protein n=1 Tax=Thermophilibacter sp. TaxID=2847309 RepID=UPI003A94FC15
MAMTHDYLDFLDERIDISPTSSEEELQAAEVISDLMGQHNVEASIEGFEAPSLSGLDRAVLAIACLLGIVLAGTGMFPLTLIGFLLAIVPAALSVLRLFGRAPRLAFGPSAQSQNVVAVHRATGPLVTKGSRTIVVAAHYDSPRENFLYTSPVAPYLTLASRLSVPCSFAVAVCAFIQLLGFLPAPFRIVVWIVGILASLPAMLPAVGAIAERTAPCTEGTNDNKAAVAALLGVLENVRPSGAKPKARPVPAAKPESDEAGETNAEKRDGDAPAPAPSPVEAEPVVGVRHGAEVLRSLGILPETCEIDYVMPQAPVKPEPPVETPVLADETAPIEAPAEDTDETDEAGTTREDLLSTGRFRLDMDEESRGVGEKDASGLSAIDEGFDPDATQPAAPLERPDAPSDPEWGKTSYRPQLSSVARRALLFDLPDPSANEVDPFATDPNATRVQPPAPATPDVVVPADQPLDTISAQDEPEELDAPSDAKPKNPVRSLLGRLRGKAAQADESDEGADERSGRRRGWRGGAAARGGLRLVGEDDQAGEETPTDEELRDAVLALGDDELIAHDIWFVALGGSALDHAGMRSFLARHRSEIRGCFVVNLDCVGAGRLVTLKNEGLEETRRADRRLTRLLAGAAADLHVELGQETHDWADTDATPAMRSSLRAVTVMGLDDNGFPALSRTPEDTMENVSGDQAAQVAAVVTEMIRRS